MKAHNCFSSTEVYPVITVSHVLNFDITAFPQSVILLNLHVCTELCGLYLCRHHTYGLIGKGSESDPEEVDPASSSIV